MRTAAEAVYRAAAADMTWPGDAAAASGLRVQARPAASGGRRPSAGDTAAFGDVTTAPSAGRDWSDRALVAAVLLRREDAFAELYRRHVSSVAAVSRMILGSGPDGDDVAAEVFSALWLMPESFDPTRGSLLAFLLMKARGRSIDLVRSTVARRRREVGDVVADVALQLVPTPDEMVVRSESADVLRRAISSLPPGEREPICLAFFEGMSYKAVAVRLGIPEGTAKSRVRSGLRRLRAHGDLGLWSEGWAGGDGDRGGRSPSHVACRPPGPAAGRPGQVADAVTSSSDLNRTRASPNTVQLEMQTAATPRRSG